MIHNISRFIAALALLATAQGAWAWDGSGTAESPYQIKSTADLDQLASDVNNGTTYVNKYFVLTTDLTYDPDVLTIDNDNDGTNESNYTAIGFYKSGYKRFSGHFDGQNHTISGIRIYKGGDADADKYQGIFAVIANVAEVKNVFLANTSITGSSSCGGIIGRNEGTVSNCHVLSTVTVHGVYYPANYHGGIVGTNLGTVTGCTSAASVTDTSSSLFKGGIAGGNEGTVSDCIYLGNTIEGSKRVGAIVGDNSATVRNCYYISTTFQGKENHGYTLANDASATGYNTTSATVTDVRLATSDDFAVSGDTYTIGTAAGWSVMCAALYHNDTYNRFSGKTVQLGADITVTRMAGGDGHAFTGTFDGGGHTLTLDYANTDNNTRTAPFSYVDGATIQNLIVGGTISGDHYRAAGIIGETVNTTSHITNCVSSVDISSGRYTGGFSIGGNVEIEGCVFNGKIKGTTYSGGFIGHSYSAQVIKNSLFAPQDGSSISGGTFYYNGGGDVAPVNSYYTQALGTAQGKACHSVTAGTDVTVAHAGVATHYATSGITAYKATGASADSDPFIAGLLYNNILYAGSDDQLSLTLTTSAQCDQAGYQYAYTASAGTLSGTTLTMPDQDVTVSVNTAALDPIDWATVNQGNSVDDPYMIYNKDQLLLLAHRVNGTNGETAVNNGYQGKFFKLGADITFDHPVAEPDDYAENYEAIGGNIGGAERYFYGKFDGDGHTVSGIRIRKTGSDDADCYQGLFGRIGGSAVIHDVHLTDARITGCANVGGIAGYNHNGHIMRCSVTDSYITATGIYYGTICGWNQFTYQLTNNYYHGCTVNGTAVTSGVGCNGADIAANHGALPAYAITLGANITTPPETFAGQTEWLDTPPVGARLAPENGFTLAGNHYFASGYEFTPGSTLASGAVQGYTPRAILGGQLLDLYTPTDNAPDYTGTAIARLTITADCDRKTLKAAIRSDGQQHDVCYTEADGTTQTAQAVALDGTEKSLAAGWYFVGKNISYDATLTLDGDVHLILVDGKTMKVRITKERDCISAEGHSLHIYGQTEGTGALNAQTNGKLVVVIRITNGTLGIHGGNVNANAESTVNTKSAIRVERATAGDALVIDRGTLTANSNSSCGIYIEGGDARINGGQVTATGAKLGIDISDYEDEDDESLSIPGILTLSGGTLTASSFDTSSGESWAGTLAIAPGHTYTDGTSLYGSTTETATLAALGGKTLQPCLALADAADNTAAITAHAGQTLAVALSGRTLYKDGSWNTLCLPFDISTASGTLSGDNVQAMTLNTATSNLADGTLTLNFDAAETIPAGTPFIIKWDESGTDITNPVFEDVTVSNATNDATVAGVLTFTGTYDPVSIGSEGDNTKLYLGAANKLYYPTKTMTIGTHRAYFQLADGITAGNSAGGNEHGDDVEDLVRAFALNFGDDEATGIISVHDSGFTVNGSAAWYTLDGRRLDAQPTAKGHYIHGGKKVAIK